MGRARRGADCLDSARTNPADCSLSRKISHEGIVAFGPEGDTPNHNGSENTFISEISIRNLLGAGPEFDLVSFRGSPRRGNGTPMQNVSGCRNRSRRRKLFAGVRGSDWRLAVRNFLKSNRLFSGCERLADVNCSGNSIRLKGSGFDWAFERKQSEGDTDRKKYGSFRNFNRKSSGHLFGVQPGFFSRFRLEARRDGFSRSNRLFSGCERLADVNCSGNSIRLNWTGFD